MMQQARYRKETRQPVDRVSVESVALVHVEATFVPALKMAPRAPLGPSEVLNAGTPFSGMAFDLQKSAAVKSETWTLSTS